jgi:hypothetical protein
MGLSESECVFWLYLGANRKDKALEWIDKIESFRYYFSIFHNHFGIESLDYIEKFNDWVYVNSPQYNCSKVNFINLLINKIIETKGDLMHFYSELLARNLFAYNTNIAWVISLACSNGYFDIDMFDVCMTPSTSKNILCNSIELAAPIYGGGSSETYLMNAIKYYDIFMEICRYVWTKGCTATELETCLQWKLRKIDLTSNDGYQYFVKLYNAFELEFNHRFNAEIILAPILVSQQIITELPIYTFLLDREPCLSTQITSFVFRYYYSQSCKGYQVDLNKLLQFFIDAVEAGAYDSGNNLWTLILVLDYGLSDNSMYEIVDKFCDAGLDLDVIFSINLDNLNINNKVFADYLLDRYPNYSSGENVLWLCCVANRFSDFDVILRSMTKIEIDKAFQIKKKFYDYVGLHIFDYIENGVYKPDNINTFIASKKDFDEIELFTKFLDAYCLTDSDTDEISPSAFVATCIKMYSQKQNPVIMDMTLNAIHPTKYAESLIALVQECYAFSFYDSHPWPKFENFIENFVMQNNEDLSAHKTNFENSMNWCIIDKRIRSVQSQRTTELWVKILEKFKITRSDKQKDSYDSTKSIDFIKVLSGIEHWKQENGIYVFDGIDCMDFIVKCIENQPLSLQMITTMFNNIGRIPANAKEMLKSFTKIEKFRSVLKNIHINIFADIYSCSLSRNTWFNNKCICEFILEENGFL